MDIRHITDKKFHLEVISHLIMESHLITIIIKGEKVMGILTIKVELMKEGEIERRGDHRRKQQSLFRGRGKR